MNFIPSRILSSRFTPGLIKRRQLCKKQVCYYIFISNANIVTNELEIHSSLYIFKASEEYAKLRRNTKIKQFDIICTTRSIATQIAFGRTLTLRAQKRALKRLQPPLSWPKQRQAYIQKKFPQFVGTKGTREKKWRRPTLPQLNAVPSARLGLTSLFGMGRGGTPTL